jgi:SAM-dependent methyltransferase
VPGWSFTDTAILDGWGRGSAMVPAMIAAAHPDLASVGSFLDVGTGVGLLALAAATVWPDSTIVGIDTWEPSLERARANVDQAGLGSRITLRTERLAEVADVDAFDCAWLPTFFLSDEDLDGGVQVAAKAVRPGGWIVLGRNRAMPVPLANAVATLRVVRAGGSPVDADDASARLERAGCVDVHVPDLPPHVPIELVLGRRPA